MKRKFDSRIAIVLAILILTGRCIPLLPGALSARESRGVMLVITLKDGQTIAGELIAVKPDSLLLLAGKDESVDLVRIRSIRIVKKSKASRGAAYGGAASLAATIIYAAMQKSEFDRFGAMLGGVLLFIPAGIVTGLLIGKHAGKDKTIQLEGKSESEVSQALAYLRGKARIRDHK
jgi:hypothetical protein